jgi:hypothetical protein
MAKSKVVAAKAKRVIDNLIGTKHEAEVLALQRRIKNLEERNRALIRGLDKARDLWGSTYVAPKVLKAPKKKRSNKFYTRVAITDTHGIHIDIPSRDAFLNDLEVLRPEEVVFLGDHMDCGSVISRFQVMYMQELSQSLADDRKAAADFFDEVQARCPNADFYYMQGNHERRVERWCIETFRHPDDIRHALETYGPEHALHLKQRGIKFFTGHECHCGLTDPGMIRLGECFFTHGYACGLHPAYTHLQKYGTNVVHGHNHRSQSYVKRAADKVAIGAWCGGCLCIVQPYYFHTQATDHTNGYHVQFVNKRTGEFAPWNVPILGGVSVLPNVREIVMQK